MNLRLEKKDKLVQKPFNIKESHLKELDTIASKHSVGRNEVIRAILDEQFKKDSK